MSIGNGVTVSNSIHDGAFLSARIGPGAETWRRDGERSQPARNSSAARGILIGLGLSSLLWVAIVAAFLFL